MYVVSDVIYVPKWGEQVCTYVQYVQYVQYAYSDMHVRPGLTSLVPMYVCTYVRTYVCYNMYIVRYIRMYVRMYK